MLNFCVSATLAEFPIITVLITSGAHHNVFRANVFTKAIRMECHSSINKAKNAHNCGGYEHMSVESEPCKIQSKFDTEVVFDVVNWLEFDTFRN